MSHAIKRLTYDQKEPGLVQFEMYYAYTPEHIGWGLNEQDIRAFTKQGLTMMLEQSMREWEKEKGSFNPDSSWLQNSLLVDIHKKSDIVREFYFNGPVVDKMVQLIGPNIEGVTSQLTFKMRNNTKLFGWHQDNGYGELEPLPEDHALWRTPHTVLTQHTGGGFGHEQTKKVQFFLDNLQYFKQGETLKNMVNFNQGY